MFDSAIRGRDPINLQHLRRFVRPCSLPSHLRTCHEGGIFQDTQNLEGHGSSHVLHFLLCAVRTLPAEEILSLLSSSGHPALSQHCFNLRSVSVPLVPPSTAEDAANWSREYWPTIFKNNNPFGPHPSIVSRAAQEMSEEVPYYMGLARCAGEEASKCMVGLPFGAVVVDRRDPIRPTVVVAAGDARWNGLRESTKSGDGNVTAHAVTRAIGLVARKRRELIEDKQHQVGTKSKALVDKPVTKVEHTTYAKGTLAPNGYLCLDLEIYITHEPCVMCSMAILHSRFGRVIFGKHMRDTGGLTAESPDTTDINAHNTRQPRTDYGLFWRPELNWKLLAWQWVDDEPLQSFSALAGCHV